MPVTLDTLPDEVLGSIVKQLGFQSLCTAALLSKRWHGLVRPELFADVDLARRNAEETQELYDALFTEQDDLKPALGGASVRSLSFSFVEDFLDTTELKAKQNITRKLVTSLESISTLELGISLLNKGTAAFGVAVLPAIVSFLDVIKDKVGNVELTLDVFDGTDESLEEEDERPGDRSDLVSKLASISAAMPRNLVSVLHLTGVEVPTFPPSFARLFTNTALKELVLRDCGGALKSLPVIPNLTKLANFWTRPHLCALQSTFDICKSSMTSLESLHLQSVLLEEVPSARTCSAPFALPHLTQLRVGDNQFGAGSILEKVATGTALPRLALLILEMDDILDPDADLAGRIGNFESLRRIVLIEGARKQGPAQMTDGTPFRELSQACAARDIHIECKVSPVCSTPAGLALAFERMKTFSTSLAHVSMNLQETALLKVENLPKLTLHNTKQIMVGVSGLTALRQEDMVPREQGVLQSTVGEVLRHLHAPNLIALQITIFMTDDSAFTNFDSVKQVLENGLFPKLERVAGAMMAGPGMSGAYFEEYAESFRQLCTSKGIDSAALNFVSNEDLFDNLLDEDDDESIASEDVDGWESEDGDEDVLGEPDEDLAESDGGESGYGEDTSLLQLRAQHEKDVVESSDSDYAPEGESDNNGDSDDSWMTEE